MLSGREGGGPSGHDVRALGVHGLDGLCTCCELPSASLVQQWHLPAVHQHTVAIWAEDCTVTRTWVCGVFGFLWSGLGILWPRPLDPAASPLLACAGRISSIPQ